MDVQLERIGPRLLDGGRVVTPGTRPCPVQGRDDRDAHRGLHTREVREVLLRAHHEPIRAREVAEGFSERLPMAVEMQEPTDLLAGDLLGEQRAQHDGGGARILEAPHRVEVVRERRGARHQGVCELQTQVRGRQVHDASSPHAAPEITRTNRHASGLRGISLRPWIGSTQSLRYRRAVPRVFRIDDAASRAR